jgi:diguanylate cyclase (GGDEF)-like protein
MTTPQESSAELRTLVNACIMMVDDEPIMIEVVKSFLEDAGYRELVSVTDSREAIASMHRHRPDLLLLDLMMPGLTGFEILQLVRSDSQLRETPVIVLTSASDSDTKLRVLELGATDFLEKPVDPSELKLRVRNTLAFKAYRDRLAYFDPLTALPNRTLFMSQLAGAIRRTLRNQQVSALLQINLDRFKNVNDSLGHRAGDELLKQAGNRLQSVTRMLDRNAQVGEGLPGASVSRMSADEFNVLLPNISSFDVAGKFARRFISAFGQPFHIEGHELFVTLSIGVVGAPQDGDNPEALLKNAGSALDQAKQQGGNSYHFFSSSANASALERLTLESQLRRALQRDELVVHYQPKLDVATGSVIGSEALVRWQHPERGLIPPGVFIPLAEEINLITQLGAWVLKKACFHASLWAKRGLKDVGVSVNVASPHFRDGRLLADVQQTLEATGLPPELLTLELTESVLMGNNVDTLASLQALTGLGVRISLDDFGTGYSSLAYLKRMPLDELKIDKSFVSGLPNDQDGAAIVRAVIAMAKSLSLEVTAEGVELRTQLDFLKANGCQSYQGFLCSQALPLDQFVALALRVQQSASKSPSADFTANTSLLASVV